MDSRARSPEVSSRMSEPLPGNRISSLIFEELSSSARKVKLPPSKVDRSVNFKASKDISFLNGDKGTKNSPIPPSLIPEKFKVVEKSVTPPKSADPDLTSFNGKS